MLMMKRFAIPFFFLLVVSCGAYLGYQQDRHSAGVEDEIESIYKLLFINNSTQYTIMDTEGRILHYVAKHDHEVTGCPECGLLGQLGVRKDEIYERLSEDPPIAERDKLMIEDREIDKFLFRQQ